VRPLVILLLLGHAPSVAAGDIYMIEHVDGTVSFTDTPVHSGYALFDVDGPAPTPKMVNPRAFPLLDSFDRLLMEAAEHTGLHPALLKAVCLAESGMNPNAVSHAGAQGLMQLMPGTAAGLKVSDPFDPEQSIMGGARYLATQLDTFGDTRRALAAYNAGPGNVRKYNGIPPFEETRDYVVKVMDLYQYFRYQRPLGRLAP
jgi:soluble lytic murein transglycosylase-like protein